MKAINSRIDTDENKKFVILIWKYWKWLKNRHVRNFDNKRRNNPLSGCSVNNCVFTGDDSKLSTADAVIIHVQHGIFPNTTDRSERQRWVFLNDESPLNAFSMSRLQPKISDLANIFNWSMTYSCPGHFRSDCNIISGYLFYLVFENSECEEYLTEKCFYNAYSKGAIPVILGPTVENCRLLLPPNSFLHIDNFESPEELAKNIIEISKDDNKLLSYHRWRNDFEVVNEHGYFGSKSYHLCRICEALNYNDRSNKVYTAENLRKYFDPKFSCR
ncbi:unnamed protein product, partial [Brenthis ino]